MNYPRIVDESWYECPAWKKTEDIKKQLVPGTFCPTDPNDIFKALRMPVDKVRLVLISQDPYPQPENACGLTYAIPEDDPRKYNFDKWPHSLQVIAESLKDSMPDPEDIEAYFDPTMKYWEDQGILLLNSSLTCNKGVPGSHRNLWKPFMQSLISWLQEKRLSDGLIWYFHGAIAKELSSLVFDMGPHKFFSHHPAGRFTKFEPKFDEINQLYKKIFGERYGIDWFMPF